MIPVFIFIPNQSHFFLSLAARRVPNNEFLGTRGREVWTEGGREAGREGNRQTSRQAEKQAGRQAGRERVKA